eukprot:359467-Chlamydomonas_euryale.AAC.5
MDIDTSDCYDYFKHADAAVASACSPMQPMQLLAAPCSPMQLMQLLAAPCSPMTAQIQSTC